METYDPQRLAELFDAMDPITFGDLSGHLLDAALKFSRGRLSYHDCEDIVEIALDALLSGQRNVSTRFDLANNTHLRLVLCGIIRSIVCNTCRNQQKMRHRQVKSLSDVPVAASPAPSPEVAVEHTESVREFSERVAAEPHLVALLEYYLNGGHDARPGQAAEALGVSPNRFRELRQMLQQAFGDLQLTDNDPGATKER